MRIIVLTVALCIALAPLGSAATKPSHRNSHMAVAKAKKGKSGGGHKPPKRQGRSKSKSN